MNDFLWGVVTGGGLALLAVAVNVWDGGSLAKQRGARTFTDEEQKLAGDPPGPVPIDPPDEEDVSWQFAMPVFCLTCGTEIRDTKECECA